MTSACTRVPTSDTTQTAEQKAVSEILKRLPDAPQMPIYKEVLSSSRKISIVFEGYSDEATMMALADLLAEKAIDTVIFIPGNRAMEHPEVIQYIADAGIDIGNYTLTGEPKMQMNKARKNARQFYRTQKAITTAGAPEPRFLRCNLTEYSEEMLKLAGLCNLKAAVQPSEYLNHRSFANEEQAVSFVRSVPRGSVISIKIGQELDATEVRTKEIRVEKPADDPGPGINASEVDIEKKKNDVNIVELTRWLIDACVLENYEILSLDDLQKSAEENILENEVPEELLEKLDISLYPGLVTTEAFGVEKRTRVPDSYFNKSVFVGDSIMVGIENYVETQRRQDPDFMGKAQFLSAGGLSVRNSLWEVSDESRHPSYEGERRLVEDAIALMDVDNVYIMLGMNDILLSDKLTYLDNYQILIRLIKEKSPNVQIHIISITPGTNKKELEPSNRQILEYNLALVEFCAKYGYHYIDVAYALRSSDGSLPVELCSDPEGMGFHFAEEACAKWLEYIYTHVPNI